MTFEEIGQLLAATAEVGDWVELAAFESSGLFILIMSDDMTVSLGFDPETLFLRATFDVATLPSDPETRRERMETLLNANTLNQDRGGVCLGLSPHDDTVTLTATLPAKRGGERELAARLSGLAELVEAWRPLIGAASARKPAVSAQSQDQLILFRA
jgi:hypothetical protein